MPASRHEKRTMLDKQRDPLLEKQVVVEQQRAAIVAQKARGTFRELAEDWYDTLPLLPMICSDSCGAFSDLGCGDICCRLTLSRTWISRTLADRSGSAG